MYLLPLHNNIQLETSTGIQIDRHQLGVCCKQLSNLTKLVSQKNLFAESFHFSRLNIQVFPQECGQLGFGKVPILRAVLSCLGTSFPFLAAMLYSDFISVPRTKSSKALNSWRKLHMKNMDNHLLYRDFILINLFSQFSPVLSTNPSLSNGSLPGTPVLEPPKYTKFQYIP